VRRLIPRHKAVGSKFFNSYAESVQLYWDAPGPNQAEPTRNRHPKGSFLQKTLHPGTNLDMKSYVGHCFHAEVAGETVWSVKMNAKQRQAYNINRSQKAVCTQDLLKAFSFKNKVESAPVAIPFSSNGTVLSASSFGMASPADINTGPNPVLTASNSDSMKVDLAKQNELQRTKENEIVDLKTAVGFLCCTILNPLLYQCFIHSV
jgi:hypothetical protein